MSIATSSEATRLIGLAERMGIPTHDAIHQVLMHLTREQQLDEVGEAVRSITRIPPSAGANGTGSPIDAHRRYKAS